MKNNIADIQEMNEKYKGLDMERMFATSLMGFPLDVDSGRCMMFSSEVKQILCIKNPDVPRVLTGYENIFGNISHAFKQLNGDWKVVRKIEKYPSIYTLVLYNKKTDTYDMVEKVVGEALSEKFGYLYNTEVMDNLQVGDTVKNGTVLYKSESLDDNMNYCLGKNALCAYCTSTATIEDAVKIRRGFADQYISTMVSNVEVSINDNDVLLFMHGDKESGLRTLPKLGECLKDKTVLCATRRLTAARALYDLNMERLTKVLPTDMQKVVAKNTVVYDVTVYYNNNNNEFPDNVYFKELKYYYDASCRYYDEIKEVTNEIKDSGSNYTRKVTDMKAFAERFNDKIMISIISRLSLRLQLIQSLKKALR